MSVWIVVQRGRVLGHVTAAAHAEALRLAAERYGRGVRVTAPGMP